MSVATEKPTPEAKAGPTPAPAAEAAPAAAAPAAPTAAARAPRAPAGPAVVGMGEVWKGLAIACAIILLLAAAVALQKRLTLRNDAPEPVEEPVQENVAEPVSLQGQELLALGKEALAGDDLDLAQRMFEEARVPVGEGDLSLQIEIFEGLAEIADRKGDEGLERLYRDHADRLRGRLGTALELLGAAESALAQGRPDVAVQKAAGFLLRTDELDERAQVFIARARVILAEAWTRRFDEAAPDAPRLPTAPEIWPDAR